MTLDLGDLDKILERLMGVAQDAYWDGEFPQNLDAYRVRIVAALTGAPTEPTTDTGLF